MKKGILLILDGYGEGAKGQFNAVENANTPFIKNLKKEYASCLLKTDSNSVGLPCNTMGGSEVGHMTIGGGQIKRSMQLKIDEAIENGEFFKNKALIEKFNTLKQRKGALHICGLWSDKQIHSNINHCFALMKFAKEQNIEKVFIHAFTDGRDCAPQSCMNYFEKFNEIKNELNIGEIATVGGRFYAMDRENNYDRVDLAVSKMCNKVYDYKTVEECIKESYDKNIFDEYIVPTRIKTEKDYDLDCNDLVCFFNTREDRMREIVAMVCDLVPCDMLTFCNFHEDVDFMFEEDYIKNGLSEYLSKQNLKQVKISESTKYAHVTYFFNGGIEQPFANEDRIHIETEKVMDFAKTPLMRAKEITEATTNCIKNGKYDFIVVNFSNPDMIGHTGDYGATVTALEFLDSCVKEIVEKAKEFSYFVAITADHGNAEEMRDEKGSIKTSHTLNPVRFILVEDSLKNIKLKDGGLVNIAPTIVKLMELPENSCFSSALF